MPKPQPSLILAVTSLLLPATTKAVDLRLYLTTPNCTGAYISCLAHEPEACCGTGPIPSGGEEMDIVSVMWTSIPAEWSLIFSSYTGGECGKWLDSDVSAGRESVCGAGGAYTGISYEFLSLLDDGDDAVGRIKNGEGIEARSGRRDGNKPGGSRGGQKCKRADLLVLEDGTERDLSGLDDDAYAQALLQSAENYGGMLDVLG